MRHEVVTLTQRRAKPYAEEGVIFMAEEEKKKDETTEVVEESTEEKEEGKKEKKVLTPEEEQAAKEARIQERVDTWKQKFEKTLEEAAERHKINKEILRDSTPSVISYVLRGVETEKLESILAELRDMERAAVDTSQIRQIRQAESTYRNVLEEATRRSVEAIDVTREETIGVRVFSNFQKYLGLEGVTVQVDPSSEEIEIHRTNDGQEIVSVPEPTLENMINVARQLNLAKFSETTTSHLSGFAEELKMAASLLDSRSFSPEAVMVLYNAGSQLEQLIQNANQKEPTPLKKITSYKELFPILHQTEFQPQNISQEMQDKIFFNLLMGGQHKEKEFMRWRRQHPDEMELSVDEQKEAFETYLQGRYADRERRERLLQHARPFIERSLRTGGKATQLVGEEAVRQIQPELMQKLLDPWRMVVGERGYKEVADKFRERMQLDNTEMADRADSEDGLLSVLSEINNEFRPGSVDGEALDFLPADLAEQMREDIRNPIACIIAVAYEKEVLEKCLGEGYLVLPEMKGNHATLLVVNLEDPTEIIRLDPSAPKKVREKKFSDADEMEEEELLGDEEGEEIEEKQLPIGAEMVSPSDPVAAKIIAALDDSYSSDLLESYIADTITASEVLAKGLTIDEEDADGIRHTVIAGDRLVTSALLTNMAATEEYWEEQDMPDDQKEALRIAAAAQATQIAPENQQAWAVKGVLENGGSTEGLVNDEVHEQSIAAARAKELGVEFEEGQTAEDFRVGWWNPSGKGAGTWGSTGTAIPVDVKPIIDEIDDAISHVATFKGVDPNKLSLKDLSEELLKKEMIALDKVVEDYTNKVETGDPTAPSKDEYEFATEKVKELEAAFRDKAKGGRDENYISSFNLTPREQAIFAGEDTEAMKRFIDNVVMSFGKAIEPGFPLPNHETEYMEGKLKDLLKTLRSNPKLESDKEMQKVREDAEAYTRILYAVLAASELESGDERALEGAQQKMLQMDNAGGHDVMLTLNKMSEGRPQMIAEEYGRRMEQVRQEKKKLVKKAEDIKDTIITANEYRKVREDLIKDQIVLAEKGLGRYGHLKYDPTMRADDRFRDENGVFQQDKLDQYIKDLITTDTNFATILFIIDGRASAIGIRGDDGKIYDPSSDAFVDQQYKNHVRYDALTPAKEKVFHLIREERARWWVKLRYGENMLKHLKDSHNLDTFIKLNGIELLVQTEAKYWENQFIRIRPMLYSMGEWKKAHNWQGENPNADEHQYALGLRLLWALQSGYSIKPGTEFSNIETADPILYKVYENYVGHSTKDGKHERDGEEFIKDQLKWSVDKQRAYRKKSVQYGMMVDYVSQFYPDMLMKPFAYEHDVWTDKNGAALDPRFVSFFTGDHTAFLDGFGVPGGLSGRELAQARFKVFQDAFAPLIASLRSENINGIDPSYTSGEKRLIELGVYTDKGVKANLTEDEKKLIAQLNPTNKDLRRGNPKQTNFGAVVCNEFDSLPTPGPSGHAVPGTAEAFRNMMAEMTKVLIATGGDTHHELGLSKQPKFDGSNVVFENRNSLIGRLAYDPMMEHILRQSPITISDIPYWMLHGEDIYGKDNPYDIRTAFGGENQVARWVSDAKNIGHAREGILKVPLGNPNQFDETFIKPLMEVIPTVAAFYGNEMGMELRASVGGALMKAMFAENLDLVGAERLSWFKNSTKFRKIYGRRTQGWGDAELKTRYWTEYAPSIKPEYQKALYEYLFGKRRKRIGRSMWKIFFTIFMMTVAESVQTGAGVFQGELKG